MENDMSDIIKNVKNMVDSGNIPENLKDIISNLQNSNNNNSNSNAETNSNSNNFSPDDLNNLFSSFTNSSSNSENNDPSFDINTLLKMKSIISTMNKKDDPRTNLLYSLKPYLRNSRKSKLDQYVNLLNMTKMADIFKANNKENSNDT